MTVRRVTLREEPQRWGWLTFSGCEGSQAGISNGAEPEGRRAADGEEKEVQAEVTGSTARARRLGRDGARIRERRGKFN